MAVADLRGGVRDARPPLCVQILSISCSFWENLAKLRVHAPPLEGSRPPLGEILDPSLHGAAGSTKKKGKRHHSGVVSDGPENKEQKRKRLSRERKIHSESSQISMEDGELPCSSDEETPNSDETCSPALGPSKQPSEPAGVGSLKIVIPQETPEWGVKLFEFIQNEFQNVAKSFAVVDRSTLDNKTRSILLKRN